MLRQAFASSLQLKQMLIPEDLLQGRSEGVLKSLHVDDVVAGIRDEPDTRSGQSAEATQDDRPPQS